MDWLATIPQQAFDIAWRQMESEVIIIPLERQPKKGELLFILNDTGSRIWNLIDGKRTTREITALLAAEFDVDLKEAQFQVVDFFTTLRKEGVLEKSERR